MSGKTLVAILIGAALSAAAVVLAAKHLEIEHAGAIGGGVGGAVGALIGQALGSKKKK